MKKIFLSGLLSISIAFCGILPTIQSYDSRTGKPIWGTTDGDEHYNGKNDSIRVQEGQILAPQGSNNLEVSNYARSGLESVSITLNNISANKQYGKGMVTLLPQTFTITLGETKEVSLYPANRNDSYGLPIKILVSYTTDGGRTSPTILLEPNADNPVTIPLNVDNEQHSFRTNFNSTSGNSSGLIGEIILSGNGGY